LANLLPSFFPARRQRIDIFGLHVKLPPVYYLSNHSKVETSLSALLKNTTSELLFHTTPLMLYV